MPTLEDVKRHKIVLAVDIDETICFTPVNRDYKQAVPILDRIEKVNEMYDAGCYIVYYTARGSLSDNDYYELTYNQLKSWNCKFHELNMLKIYYTEFWCDRSRDSEAVFADFSKHKEKLLKNYEKSIL